MSSPSQRTSYMLSDRHFALMIVVALLIHLSGFVVWTFSPKPAVRELQIRMMNIRLGDGDEMMLDAPQPAALPANVPQVEALVDKLADDAMAPKPQPEAKVDTNEVKQYVREVNAPRTKKTGVKDGARDAEITSRYTQLTSLWVKKFQRYPEEMRQKGAHGTVVVRIRIDRRGNIGYYAVERSSGVPELDHAAIDMIRRANPIPAVPKDYPEGESFEFLIPVIFSLS